MLRQGDWVPTLTRRGKSEHPHYTRADDDTARWQVWGELVQHVHHSVCQLRKAVWCHTAVQGGAHQVEVAEAAVGVQPA